MQMRLSMSFRLKKLRTLPFTLHADSAQKATQIINESATIKTIQYQTSSNKG